MHPKEKLLELEVPDNPIVKAMLDSLQEPMMSVTLMMPEDEYPMTDAYEINQHLGSKVDIVIDGGFCGMEPTTVVDMTEDTPGYITSGCRKFYSNLTLMMFRLINLSIIKA